MSVVVRFYKPGTPDVLRVEEHAVGEPGPGQVRLRHEAIGLNFVDTMFRDGTFPTPLPFVTGVEGAGLVEAIGPGVRTVKIGDRVVYFFAPGAYASHRLIAPDTLTRLPDDVPTAHAAALFTKGLTAWMGLFDLHPVKAGDVVLVQGASGGVGALLARWARALGATVIGTGSPNKLGRVARDADHALASDDPELASNLRSIVPAGVNVVYEMIGNATFAASAAAVCDGGTIATIGAASGQPAIDHDALAARGVRVTAGSTPRSLAGRMEAATSALFEAYRQGVFQPLDVARYALTDVARAHHDIARRGIAGSAILMP